MPADLRSCQPVGLHADGDALMLLLEADGRDVPVRIPLREGTAWVLEHLAALHGHSPGCGGSPDVHVGLLLRSLRAAGAWPLLLLVRPLPGPAFWLRLMADEGPVDVDVSALDAAALIMSRRLPLALAGAAPDPWDRTCAQLLGQKENP